MSKPMVLTKENLIAAMEGRKTQTKRIIKPQPPKQWNMCDPIKNDNGDILTFCFYDSSDKNDYGYKDAKFQVGDRAYLAEGYQVDYQSGVCTRTIRGKYLVDSSKFSCDLNGHEWDLWKARKFPYRPTPGRFMYKSLARTFMTITEVRVERLQDISEEDCEAEGIFNESGLHLSRCSYTMFHPDQPCDCGDSTPQEEFAKLWDSIHGDGAWDLNPWVFVYKWGEVERR